MPIGRSRSKRCVRAHLLVLIGLPLACAMAHAQLQHRGPAAAMALSKTESPYDVVSVRRNNSAADNGSMEMHDLTFRAVNIPLEQVIEFAYDIPSDRMSGITGQLKDQRFDIDAKVLPPDGSQPLKMTDTQLQAMIILLLQDRFHLQVHLEPRTMATYDLVVAKGGSKLKLSPQEKQGGSSLNMNDEDTRKVLIGKNDSMVELAAALTDEVHRKVVDKTGLTGAADITLKWSDDIAAELGGPDVISIFTALEDQLGLKLQSSKGPVDTLVIDHVEMPAAD